MTYREFKVKFGFLPAPPEKQAAADQHPAEVGAEGASAGGDKGAPAPKPPKVDGGAKGARKR